MISASGSGLTPVKAVGVDFREPPATRLENFSVRSSRRERPTGVFPTIGMDVMLETGCVRAVTISPGATRTPAASFVGVSAADVPARAALLYALCPVSQQLAAEGALAAAAGDIRGADRLRSCALLAEHYRENLRSLIVSWPGAAPDKETLAVLRAALAAAQGLERLAPEEIRARLDVMDACAAKLGFATKTQVPSPGLWGRSGEPIPAATLEGDPVLLVDEAMSDEAVFGALASGRPAPAGGLRATTLKQMLDARAAAIGTSLAQLRDLLDGGCTPPLWSSSSLGRGVGAAAVVSPRGRLFHVARLDAGGRVVAYRTLSPTDRAFADDGPLAQSLVGLRVGSGEDAMRRIERIAAVYDPCQAVHVTVRESVHA